MGEVGRITIVIADDHTVVRQGVRRILEADEDLDVVGEAGDGLAAVELVRVLRPHVVLMDVGLPLRNGYDAAKLIREEPWGTRMVLIALTGWGQEQDRKRSHEAGFDHHLVKPVDPKALMTLVSDLFHKERRGLPARVEPSIVRF